jgi:hypothetical protein
VKPLIRSAARACRRRPALRAPVRGAREPRTRSDRPGTARHGSPHATSPAEHGPRAPARTGKARPEPGPGGARRHGTAPALRPMGPPSRNGPAGASRRSLHPRTGTKPLYRDETGDRPEGDEAGQEQRGHRGASAPAGEPERRRDGTAGLPPRPRPPPRLRPPARPAARSRARPPPARRALPRPASARTLRTPFGGRPRMRPAVVHHPEVRPPALDQPQVRPGLHRPPRRPPGRPRPPGSPCPRGRLHGPPVAPAWPNTGRRKIGESNTVSIELPYDVVHHAVADFEEDSNNCLKMIFDGGTVALCDMRNTDREARRSHERAQRERCGRQ